MRGVHHALVVAAAIAFVAAIVAVVTIRKDRHVEGVPVPEPA